MGVLSSLVWLSVGALYFAIPEVSDSPYDRGSVTFDIANDDFGSASDEAYTSGLELSIRVRPPNSVGLASLNSDIKKLRLAEYWGLMLGLDIYTPHQLDEIDVEELRDERPYAAWLYTGLFAEIALAHSPWFSQGFSLYTAELKFGSTGPRTNVQTLHRYWHAFIRDALNRDDFPQDPRGWNVYQIPNHWGVNLKLSQEADIFRYNPFKEEDSESLVHFGLQLGSLAEVQLGNMWIDAAGGVVARMGYMPAAVFDKLTVPSTGREIVDRIPWAAYGFISVRGIASAYNALLDGPPGDNTDYPTKNNFLGRLEAGFVLRAANVEFAFRHVMLSPDLAKRPPARAVWVQNWGRFTLRFLFY